MSNPFTQLYIPFANYSNRNIYTNQPNQHLK